MRFVLCGRSFHATFCRGIENGNDLLYIVTIIRQLVIRQCLVYKLMAGQMSNIDSIQKTFVKSLEPYIYMYLKNVITMDGFYYPMNPCQMAYYRDILLFLRIQQLSSRECLVMQKQLNINNEFLCIWLYLQALCYSQYCTPLNTSYHLSFIFITKLLFSM